MLGAYDLMDKKTGKTMGGMQLNIAPEQCAIQVAPDASCVYLYALGTQPTGWRSRPVCPIPTVHPNLNPTPTPHPHPHPHPHPSPRPNRSPNTPALALALALTLTLTPRRLQQDAETPADESEEPTQH